MRGEEAPALEEPPAPSPEVEPRTPAESKPPSQAPATPDRSKADRGKTLGDELAVVESASRALRSGNPQAALGRLAEYRQRFPRGKLALEAQVLRIEALARAGRSDEAARLARGFLKRHPHSPVAARIRRYAE
jgi:outer membrane protein assembly factor BamD (BamD/ComL family)